MTCQEVQDWVLAHRDARDAAPSNVLDHVAGCSHCQQEQRFDAFMSQAMQQVEPSPELSDNILWQLRQRRRSAQRASTLYWSMAAAAAFFLAICLHWYVQQPYDLANLSTKVAALDFNHPSTALVIDQPLSKDQLVQWFQRQGVSVTIPQRLKLQFVSAIYVVESAGRKVAVLDMRAGGSMSKVCLLERRFFSPRAQRSLAENQDLASFVIADTDDADALGWMIVDRASAHLFVDGAIGDGA
jgi:hypothetical protein